MTVISGHDRIQMFQMLARKQALRLEVHGMKRRGPSVYGIIKKEHGLKGNKQSVYTQYCELVEKAKGEMT